MILQDGISALKMDIQQCVVNNSSNFRSKYRTFFFDKSNFEMIGIFGMLENLEIFPDETLMGFKCKIVNDLEFSDEEMLTLKRNVWQYNATNILDQMNNSKKTAAQIQNEEIMAKQIFQEWLDELEEIKKDFVEPTEFQKQSLRLIKDELYKIGLNLNYEEHKEMIMLCGNFEHLSFKRKELQLLLMLIQKSPINTFLIAPSYDEENEDDEECKNIRIVLGIDLSKED